MLFDFLHSHTALKFHWSWGSVLDPIWKHYKETAVITHSKPTSNPILTKGILKIEINAVHTCFLQVLGGSWHKVTRTITLDCCMKNSQAISAAANECSEVIQIGSMLDLQYSPIFPSYTPPLNPLLANGYFPCYCQREICIRNHCIIGSKSQGFASRAQPSWLQTQKFSRAENSEQ